MTRLRRVPSACPLTIRFSGQPHPNQIYLARTGLMHTGPIDDRDILRAVHHLIDRMKKYSQWWSGQIGRQKVFDGLLNRLDTSAS